MCIGCEYESICFRKYGIKSCGKCEYNYCFNCQQIAVKNDFDPYDNETGKLFEKECIKHYQLCENKNKQDFKNKNDNIYICDKCIKN
jgi:hypothetical protein